MNTRLEQILDRYLNGREIAVWGNPTRPLLRTLKQYSYHIAYDADALSPEKHYVVAVDEADQADFLLEKQSKLFTYINDSVIYNDFGAELPFEWDCYGAKIGRQTYFGEGVYGACEDGFVKSIGHFTSINSTAKISCNHQLNMTFTSDEIQNFFTTESKEKFHAALKNDPAYPYAIYKEPMTIGSDVYVGAHVFINASKVSSIGDGAIIGSGAVVLEDVPPYAVVVGVPGRVNGYRFPREMIDVLLKVKWWNWSAEEINANIDALISPDEFMRKFK